MMFKRRGGLSGVQSSPRVMRGPPVTYPTMFDVPLSHRRLYGLSGLESQGIAKTLGSLSGSTIGDDVADRAEIEMAEECMRPGEIMLSPGVCGPDTRVPINPYANAPITTAIPLSVTKAPVSKATGSASGAVNGKLSPQLIILGVVAVATIYFLGKK